MLQTHAQSDPRRDIPIHAYGNAEPNPDFVQYRWTQLEAQRAKVGPEHDGSDAQATGEKEAIV